MESDLRGASHDRIIEFVFNREPADEVDDKWYWNLDEDVETDPAEAIAFLTRLCQSCGELVSRFTLRQIAEGVNYLFGAGGKDEFGEHLWNPRVGWPDRRACIRSIPELYTQVFELDPDGAGGCPYMLWDWIAYGYYSGTRDPLTDAEDARVQDAMFDAMVSMLRSDHPETLAGAIHGLGHLSHRASRTVIAELLASPRRLPPEVRTYAAEVLEGRFQ